VVVRRLRLATGLILFAYLVTHLANHALGLISLDAMEAGRHWFLAFWRNPVATAALYGALLTHAALALVSLYRRRHFRMAPWEAAQLLLGLAIPPLLASHIVGTRVAHVWFDAIDSYARVLLGFWHLRPEQGVRQTLVLLLAWTHGCVGLHFWLRLRPGYGRSAPLLLGGAVLVPTLALLGFAHAGREVAARAAAPGAVAQIQRAARAPGAAARARLASVTDGLLALYGIGLGGVLVARGVRHVHARRRVFIVRYPGGRRVAAEAGMTVLEASRLAGIPHASVCGGRGRCSTCRIRIVRGLERLPPPSAAESRVLQRVGAPPNVRLACQVRPAHDLSVVPVLSAAATADDGSPRPGTHAGQEREVAVLFADLRRFTALAERRLPYDLVFLLNRYFAVVGGAIERSGGVTNQFTGDGVMAIFGVETGPAAGCREALEAAAELVRSVDALTQDLGEELSAPLRIGIGIHAGPAVVGYMGYGVARYLTAVGDPVQVASRLQDLTKEYDSQLVFSDAVARYAGLDVAGLPRHELGVRNRAEPVVIYSMKEARAWKSASASPPTA
jgi:adenylate cyclase